MVVGQEDILSEELTIISLEMKLLSISHGGILSPFTIPLWKCSAPEKVLTKDRSSKYSLGVNFVDDLRKRLTFYSWNVVMSSLCEDKLVTFWGNSKLLFLKCGYFWTVWWQFSHCSNHPSWKMFWICGFSGDGISSSKSWEAGWNLIIVGLLGCVAWGKFWSFQ